MDTATKKFVKMDTVTKKMFIMKSGKQVNGYSLSKDMIVDICEKNKPVPLIFREPENTFPGPSFVTCGWTEKMELKPRKDGEVELWATFKILKEFSVENKCDYEMWINKESIDEDKTIHKFNLADCCTELINNKKMKG